MICKHLTGSMQAIIAITLISVLLGCNPSRKTVYTDSYSSIRERATSQTGQGTVKESVRLIDLIGNPERLPSIEVGEVFVAIFSFKNGNELKLRFGKNFPGVTMLKINSCWTVEMTESGEILGMTPNVNGPDPDELKKYGLDAELAPTTIP